MSMKLLGTLVCGLAIGSFGMLSARADDQKTEIKGGIDGKVVKVDVEKGMLTIERPDGRQRTFSVTSETTIVGPRGGVVHHRLKDHRFHAGLPITIVATGDAASELHLGFDRKGGARKAAASTTPSDSTPAPPETRRRTGFRGLLGSKPAAEKEEPKEEAADEDNDYPGKVKSVDPAKHLLVITLLNGKDRSFMVAHDIKVSVNGRASHSGLADRMLKPGIPVTVVTEEGGRKVKEVKVTPAVTRRPRAAN
jgi:hypothetical protein